MPDLIPCANTLSLPTTNAAFGSRILNIRQAAIRSMVTTTMKAPV